MASIISAGNATNGLGISSDNTGIMTVKTGSGAGVTALTLDASQNATFAGAVSGGATFLIPNAKVFRLDAGLVGANATGAQSILGVGVTLVASTVYAFEMIYGLVKTAGTTSHTVSLGFGGGATINNILYETIGRNAATTLPFVSIGAQVDTSIVNTVASQAVTGAITAASYIEYLAVKGTVSINAGGTFIPQYTLSAAPGGAYTTAAGSYFLIYPIGASGANVNVGGWA